MNVEITQATIDSVYGHLSVGDVVAVSDESGQRWIALGIAKEASGEPTKTLQAGEGGAHTMTQEEAQARVAENEQRIAALHGSTATERARTLTQAGPVPAVDEEPSGGRPEEAPAPASTPTRRSSSSSTETPSTSS